MKIAFLLVAMLCLTPYVSATVGLLLGLAFSLILGNPFSEQSKQLTPKLLQLSVMGLGAGMNLDVIAQVGLQGIGYTAIGIGLTLGFGFILGRILATDTHTSILLGVGTAICGGSAIAAVSPIIRAKPEAVSLAMGTVFLLNAVALFIFPPIGHFFGLSQVQFGLWSALAIHDTSSVVGSASQYGAQALDVATTVKLARALWIVPVAFFMSMIWRKPTVSDGAPAVQKPWFILGFVLSAAVVTWVPELRPVGLRISEFARHALVLTLFLVGAGVSRATLRSVGFRPMLQGFCLWAMMASLTLVLIATRFELFI